MDRQKCVNGPRCAANQSTDQMREIDALSLQMYCRDNGEDSMVIVLDVVMAQDVDGGALSEAVRQAEQRYTSFGCGLATTGYGLCYMPLASSARAHEGVPGKRWQLGTSETDGRLYRVTYAGPRITVSLHHGLTDGRGAFEYLKTLLNYCMVTNVGVVDLPSDIRCHVRQASFRIPSFNATMTISVSTCNDTLTMNVTQPFASEGFGRALAEVLTQLGIPAHLNDRGLEGYDILGRSAVIELT